MKKKDVEYSKRTLSAIVKLWFAGAIFGMCYLVVLLIIAPDMASLDGLLTYIGAPMGCGVVGYLIKSAMENREKIKQEYHSDYGEEELTYEDEKGE